MRLPCLRRAAIYAGATLCLPLLALAHGILAKPMWSGKTNYAIRGKAPGTQTTKLYMMQPQQYMTGVHETVGWRFTAQDGDAATQEPAKLSYVRYAANGRDPDTSANGTIFELSNVRLFGFGLTGNRAMEFTITVGVPKLLPANCGIAIEMPGNAKWPRDGMSMHAQLNMPNDSRRPRVPPPFDKQIWAYDQPGAAGPAAPLGGRALDVLHITGLYIEPVQQLYVRTTAYGLGTEDIFGPEAYHPSAARGDAFGLRMDGGQIGADGFGLVMMSPALLKKPIRFPPWLTRPSFFYLDIGGIYPVQLALVPLDSLGQAKTAAVPVAGLPKSFRSFWLQTLIINPFSLEIEVTDAIRLQGL